MDQIVETLGPRTAAAVEIAELWQEYERAQTPEAKLVKVWRFCWHDASDFVSGVRQVRDDCSGLRI